MKVTSWTLALVVSLCVTHAKAKEPKSIKEAIANLVSENKSPVTTQEDRTELIRYPEGYDHAKQQKVVEAFTYLRSKGVEAFPELVDEKIPVEKYSCVRYVNGKGSRRPITVGQVICYIISENVDAAKYLVHFREGATVSHNLKELRPWILARRNYSLKDFQLESIAKMKSQLTTGFYSKGDYAKEMIPRLQDLEMRLQKSGKDEPLVVEGGIDSQEYKETDHSTNVPAGSKEWYLNHTNLKVTNPE